MDPLRFWKRLGGTLDASVLVVSYAEKRGILRGEHEPHSSLIRRSCLEEPETGDSFMTRGASAAAVWCCSGGGGGCCCCCSVPGAMTGAVYCSVGEDSTEGGTGTEATSRQMARGLEELKDHAGQVLVGGCEGEPVLDRERHRVARARTEGFIAWRTASGEGRRTDGAGSVVAHIR